MSRRIIPDTLYLLPHANIFYFKTENRNALKVHRVQVKMFPDIGAVYTFSADYPGALTSLYDFKAILPGGKATAAAVEAIGKLKDVPDLLAEQTLLNQANYEFKVPPYTHQAVALEYMLHFKRLALVLDMGLGKTFITVHYLDITRKKALVFGPVIVMDTWLSEIAKYTDLKVVLYRGTKKQRAKIRESVLNGPDRDWDILLSNFEGPKPRANDDMEDYHFFSTVKEKAQCLVIDEASRLLGHKSERAKVIYDLAQSMDNRYLLSGTLSKGKPTDVFMPFKIMDDEILGINYWKFQGKYCKFSPYNKHAVTGYKNLDTLKARIDPFMLNMQKDNCLDLPPRQFVTKEYFISEEQLAVYQCIRDEDIDTVYLPLTGKTLTPETAESVISPDTHGEVRCKLPIVKINKLRQVLSGFITLSPERDYRKCNECHSLLHCLNNEEKEIFPWDPDCVQYDSDNPVKKPKSRILHFKNNAKFDLLDNLLTDLGVDKWQKTKVIIWVEYKQDLANIATLLKKRKIPFVTPSTPKCEQAFQENPDNLVFLSQVSQGIGLTLNAAKVTLNYSHSLELEHRDQALERNYRIGQNNRVTVFDFVAPGSVEVGVLNLLKKKKDVKRFMQTTEVCKTCPKGVFCMENAILPYSEDCMHYESRLNAEKKETIKL
jgi:SNF2 family DNA or RNA helicase